MHHKITYIYPILAIVLVIGVVAFLHQKNVINVYEMFPFLQEDTVPLVSEHDAPTEPDEPDDSTPTQIGDTGVGTIHSYTFSDVPEFAGEPYYVVNDNVPYFTDEEYSTYGKIGYEYYEPLDSFGRCGVTVSFVGRETMPKESRGDISSVKPSGWHNQKYDFVDGGWVYNRCHLIGWQLTAENDNKCNLITGTRYMNVDGMLPFENLVAEYVKETKGHVYYRVTPIFDGSNLVADGVLMEAYSYEDKGEGVQFCVFCYNVQPGITIDYATGNNWRTK